ncbi:MAG: hypothetical protein B7Z80_12760 [Rhodospirillales bacterium 20-64-7]|nr:MAG: hypothetical protein B7Z80_12760 [Rhodospirillales bacterium 20-64-7]HQT78052.1 hypothetical protein [Rhodopila sp.]
MSPSKLDGATLTAILPRLELSQQAAAAIGASNSVPVALDALVKADLLLEAARLCAHALPPRERVWWAARCARATAGPGLSDADLKACALAEEWVRRRADDTRRAAMDMALRAGCTSPEAWTAVAAFWSGDSMAPPGQPKVPPAPHLAGTATAGAVVLASVRACPERQADRLRRFLHSALDIAAGGAGHIDPEVA